MIPLALALLAPGKPSEAPRLGSNADFVTVMEPVGAWLPAAGKDSGCVLEAGPVLKGRMVGVYVEGLPLGKTLDRMAESLDAAWIAPPAP